MNLLISALLAASLWPAQAQVQPAQPPVQDTTATIVDWQVVPVPGQPQANAQFWYEIYAPVPQGPPKTVDEAITAALNHHPDIKLAEAEMRVAEAKLAKARLEVSQKSTTDFQNLQQAKAKMEIAKKRWETVSELHKKGSISRVELTEAEAQLAEAKTILSRLEDQWSTLMGLSKTSSQIQFKPNVIKTHSNLFNPSVPYQLQDVHLRNINGFDTKLEVPMTVRQVSSNVNDVLKEHLNKVVKLPKQTNLELEPAFALLAKEAGITWRVRLPITEKKDMYKTITRIDLEAGEFPLHTWLQLIIDEMNNYQVMTAPQRQETPKRFDLYVREYGLLLTTQDLAPPDASTVQGYWKQLRLEQAAQERAEREKKAKAGSR